MADLGTLGAIFGGFAGGLAQGAEAGISLSQKQQQIQLQQEHQKIQTLALIDNLDKWSPQLRKTAGPSALKYIFKQLGVDPALAQPAIDIYTKDDDGKQKSALLGFIAKHVGESPENIQSIFQNMNIGDIAKMGATMSQIKNREDIADIRRQGIGLRRDAMNSRTDILYDAYGRPVARITNRGYQPLPAPGTPETAPGAPEIEKRGPGYEIQRPPPPGVAQTTEAPISTGPNLQDAKSFGYGIGTRETEKFESRAEAIKRRRDQMAETPPEIPQAPNIRGDQNKTGQEYLATLPAPRAALIKQYGEYQLAPPTGNSPNALQLKQDIARAYPDYDAKNFGQYVKAIKDFSASGEAGRNLRSLATAEGHLGTMVEMFRALKNGDIPAANAVVNFVRRNLGRADVTNADAARVALSDELKRVFTVVGVGSEADRKLWFETLSTAKSPEQARGVLKTMTDLLDSRIGALEKQWKDTGPPGRPMPGYPTEDAGKGRAAVRKYFEEGQPKSTPQSAPPTRQYFQKGNVRIYSDDGKSYFYEDGRPYK